MYVLQWLWRISLLKTALNIPLPTYLMLLQKFVVKRLNYDQLVFPQERSCRRHKKGEHRQYDKMIKLFGLISPILDTLIID